MSEFGRWLRGAAVCTAWIAAVVLARPVLAGPDFSSVRASADARSLVDWVRRSGDARGRPFAVVDKRAAHIYVFDQHGQLAGHSPALLGSAAGDHTVPGVGQHAQAGYVGPEERTTPSGRFDSAPGENASGEHVVWVDYASAFAIHRLRPGFAYKARAERLANLAPRGKRVSWGCVVVPVPFYQQVVERVLGKSRSVVYVMPETRPLQAMFQALEQR
jgi:primosomal protein N'